MSEVAHLEKHAAKLKRQIQLKNISERLAKNADFKKLILQEFMVDECARYAQTAGDPALTAEQRADALALAMASGHLKRYLSVVYKMGVQAENDLRQTEDAITELREQGVEDVEVEDDQPLISASVESVGGLD